MLEPKTGDQITYVSEETELAKEANPDLTKDPKLEIELEFLAKQVEFENEVKQKLEI